MEIRTMSIEIIKPSSPTPHHLKSHKLSLMDQFNLDTCYGFLLFYSRVDKNITDNISHLLKKSLSKALTHYYPFAGQVEDDFVIACDDSGVPFVEAHVAINMSEVLGKPEMNTLEKLMPYNPNRKVSTTTTQVNFAVQLNYFDCGGVAVCVSLKHVIADGTALAYFLKNWAAIARGSIDDIKDDVIFDCTSMFPPSELAASIMRYTNEKHHSMHCITKRFAFDGTKIAASREKIQKACKFSPTRFEIVSALIWGALISMARKSGDASPFMVVPVNVRKRMNPLFPDQCIGNFIHSVTGNWMDNNKIINYGSLAKKIHQLVEMVNGDEVRKYYNGEDLANQLRKIGGEFINDINKVSVFAISSLCGLPFYEADFGWGKPTWGSVCVNINNVASLVDASDGKGVEAWMGLSEKDLAKFEQDPGILTYASFDPIVVSSSKL